MDVEQIKQALGSLVETINSDPMLDDELRETMIELSQEALGDPTPDNLKALSIVLDRLGESERYANAMDVIAGIE